MPVAGFADRLVRWQADHGRRDLPWQRSRDPYRVWLSEIMLQQTQVATVIGYYERFVAHFPTVQALAAAPLDAVMPLWAGLGYYARARNLHACAQAVVRDHGGAFPRRAEQLARLPGIGRSTAAAIAAFCFDERVPILDGNVKRVLARHFAVEGDLTRAAAERRLWQLAADLLPAQPSAMPAYTQAVMDLGATLCTRAAPRCADCPLRSSCRARREGRVDELPAPRARRRAPLRRAQWLVAVADDRVLLQRRPAAGLWGGLLALPQFDTPEALAAWALRLAPAADAAPVALPARRHAFTHFTLEFVPQLLRLARLPQTADDPAWHWLPLAEASAQALPTPVRRLLAELAPT